ncbi:MAG TPA: hypothetical protein VGM56_25995 [Byssovorax sp.]|jgi:hypothetical protein
MDAALFRRLLRDPEGVARACREDRDVRDVAAVSLLAVLVGACAFGCAVGSFRGGVQIVYAGVKVPLAMIGTLALAAPAFHGVASALGRPWPMRATVALALAAAGRAALLMLAFAPALWLLFDFGVGYHTAALLASCAYGASGLAALGVLVRGLGAGPGRALTALGFVAVFFAVGGQTSWVLRPYLVRPRTATVPFARSREGGFADAVFTSGRSSMGIYTRSSPDEPREDAR